MGLVSYFVDVVKQTHEGRHDYSELLCRIKVHGRSKAVETAEETDWYMTNVAKQNVAVFFYKEERAPSLESFTKVSI